MESPRHPASIFMPDWMSRERIDLIRSLGATIHPLEPANSPTLTTGEFIPPIVGLGSLDRIVSVDDGDAILMAQKLATQLGLAVGISSGANFLGAVQVQESLGPDAVVVTVFSDDNKKYLSTDLLRDEPVRDHFVAPAITLTGFGARKRVCRTCCDPADCVEGVSALDESLMLPPCPRRTMPLRRS